MLDCEPVGFEVTREEIGGERTKVLYSRHNDKYFQLQESLNECSTFIQDQILKETQVFLITPMDPFFIMLPSLLRSQN